jgi:hypothetical protein
MLHNSSATALVERPHATKKQPPAPAKPIPVITPSRKSEPGFLGSCDEEGEVQMNSSFSLSVFVIEIDGKPTLAVQAKRHREVESFCEQDWLRADLLALTSNGRPLYDAGASLKVRLARSKEVAVYRQATEAGTSSDDFNVVYLVDVDDPASQPDISEGPEPPAREDTVQ